MKYLKELVNRKETSAESLLLSEMSDKAEELEKYGYTLFLVEEDNQDYILDCLSYLDIESDQECVDMIDNNILAHVDSKLIKDKETAVRFVCIKENNVMVGGKVGMWHNRKDDNVYASFVFRKDLIDKINKIKLN